MSFRDFALDEKILKVLDTIGYKEPTDVQRLAIPEVLKGVDIKACAKTGTGKTGAFLLPAIHLLTTSTNERSSPQVLILAPTRELVMQIAKESEKFTQHLPFIKTVCVYGGVPYPLQKRMLSRKYDILVATPGRLIDHMGSGRIDLSNLKILILDEADRMLDMGFIDAVEQIASKTPKSRQTLLFSATLDRRILSFSNQLQRSPIEIKVAEDLSIQSNIVQHLYFVDNLQHKQQVLENILDATEAKQAIVFTSTKNQADILSHDLNDKGYVSLSLHGDMEQRHRTRTIKKLREGEIDILVATDVAARGIDIIDLGLVINFDLPFKPEDFIHRIGRTGRAGNKGLAITFATYKETAFLSRIHQLTQRPMQSQTIVGLEPKTKKESFNQPSLKKKPQPLHRKNGTKRKGVANNKRKNPY